jgi:hypothetical protein
MARKKAPAETKVESIRHKDKRTNVPTEELRDFVADDDQAPNTMLNPRDPSLDLRGKNTGAGKLFMVFGEPDVEVKKNGNELTIEIKGVDVNDPTTGQIRNATDDIDCWFIGTNYNDESFFVRHAYFTGADEPYEKLEQALKAQIDEPAWSSLYSTTSRPFPRPASKRPSNENAYAESQCSLASAVGLRAAASRQGAHFRPAQAHIYNRSRPHLPMPSMPMPFLRAKRLSSASLPAGRSAGPVSQALIRGK